MGEDKGKRTKRTAAEKATHALGVAQRYLDKIQRKHDEHMAAAEALEPEIDAARQRRDYLAQDPALPKDNPTPDPAIVADVPSESEPSPIPHVETPRG